MCGSMVDIQSAMAENRRKKKNKLQDRNIMFASATHQGRLRHGGSGGGCPLALVVRGRTGAEKCPLLQYKSYYTSKEQV